LLNLENGGQAGMPVPQKNNEMTANWTIDGVRDALAAKKIAARELAADFYTRIEARNPELNAYLALSPERARRQADRIDALVAEGKRCRHWQACLLRSRTSSAREARKRRAARKSSRLHSAV